MKKSSLRLPAHFVLIINLFFSVVNANEITHFTANQGLSGTDITAICENENYIWIATNDGLCRFDGKVFKVFKKETGAANCISENNIETLRFDSDGLLWIGFKTGGADVYDPKKGTFTHIGKLTDQFPQRVISIYEDSRKRIWLGSWEEGLYELTPATKGKFRYKTDIHLKGFIVSSIIEQPGNRIWAGTYAGLYYLQLNSNKWFTCDSRLVVSQLVKSSSATFWCSTWNEGILKITCGLQTSDKPDVKPVCAKGEQVYRIYPFHNNQMYIGTWGNGLKTFNQRDEKIQAFDTYFRPPVILSLLKDSYNNFWVGTYGNGLFKITTAERGIWSFSPINTNGYAAAFTVKSLADNVVILGSEGDGLYQCNLARSTLTRKANGILKGRQNNFILSIYKDDHLIIVGHDDEGIYFSPVGVKNPENINFKVFKTDKRLAKVTSIFKSGDNRFWFGTKQNGLITAGYNTEHSTFENFTFYNLTSLGQITGLAQYDDQRIWIASHSGLSLFNTSTRSFDKTRRLKISEMIYSMVRDVKNECLWLGTSVGLRKLNYLNNDVMEVPFSGLLPQGAINNLLIDTYNNLWFSVGSRVFCLTDKNRELKEINLGEFGNQLFLSSAIVRAHGRYCVVLGGEKSLVVIDPLVALNQANESKIIFTELQIDHSKVNVGDKIYGRVVLGEQTEYVSKIEFSYRCKWVSLSFTQVGWNNFKNHYQYKIDGFSQNWQFLDLDKPIIFSQLQPGNYHLIIKRVNASMSENPLWQLDINVIPPWWRTTWFYTLLIISLSLIFILIIYLIINHYKKLQNEKIIEMEKKKKEEVLLEKESFFAGLSHDLLTPFSLIIAPATDLIRSEELSPDNMEKVRIINKNATYLSDIFKTILDFRRIESIDLTIEERKIELISFVRVIVDSFGYLARSRKINFNFNTDTESFTIMTDVVKLERILFNLLSNAFKFTDENGSIQLQLHCYPDRVHFSVTDSGVGIEADKLELIFEKFYQNNPNGKQQGFGLGLYIVRKFIEILHGKINITSGKNAGTTVNIELPVQVSELEMIGSEVTLTTNNDAVPILLVEDNEEMKNYLKNHLAKSFNVATASNGTDAFDYIRNNLPEIVISDVMMSGMDGLALCQKIKTTSLTSDIFVVLISAKSSPEDEWNGYKAGADFYIAKPFDCERFVTQINNIYATRLHRRRQILKSIFNQTDINTSTSPKDDFLYKAIQIIEQNIMNENFKIDDFALQMNVSKTVLHRKFRMLVDDTPNNFIRQVRLNKAAEMLVNTQHTIAEIAYLTGFNQSHYFIKCFREEYNDTPKNFRQQHKTSLS